MKKRVSLMACMLGISTLTGCATIVSDNKSAVQIDSNPTGTMCEVKGENFTQTVTIPANATIPAKAAPVTITCEKEGYFPSSDTITTSMDGWIFGNIIFGGIPGVIIDAVTKSGFKYQENVALHLYKRDFLSEEEKNSYYADMLEKLNAEVQAKKAKLLDRDPKSDTYKKEMKKIEKYHEEKLNFLQACKEQAIILPKEEKKR